MERQSRQVDLCSRASRIGCAVVLVFLASSTIALTVMAPATLLLFSIYLPLAPLGLRTLRSFRESAGQSLELTSEDVTLYREGELLWKLRWSEIELVKENYNYDLDLIDRGGTSHRIVTVNLPRPARNQLEALIPPGVARERNQLVFGQSARIPLPRSVMIGLAIGGVAAFTWGCFDLVGSIVLLKTGDPTVAPSLRSLGWQTTMLLGGMFAGWLGLRSVFPKLKPAEIEISKPDLRLDHYLQAVDLSRLSSRTLTWRTPDKSRHHYRNEGLFIMACTLIWGSGLVWAVGWVGPSERGGAFLDGMYGFIVAFHLSAILAWRSGLDPAKWTIKTEGAHIWVESTHASYPASVTRSKKPNERAELLSELTFSLEGRRRALQTKSFFLDDKEANLK